MVYCNPHITGQYFIPYITQPTGGPLITAQMEIGSQNRANSCRGFPRKKMFSRNQKQRKQPFSG